MRLLSKINTNIAYDARRANGERITLKPGVNVLSDADKAALDADANFKAQTEKGFFVILPDAAPAASAPVADEPAPAVNPRDRLPGESNNAFKARMKALDAAEAANKPDPLSPDDQKMVDAYTAIATDEAREGFKAMLDDRQRDVLAKFLANEPEA